MSAVLKPHGPAATFDEDGWNDLLDYIEDRRVIPIVGPELLRVETDTGPRLLYDWLADKLAARLGVDTALLPESYTLNDVVCWFLSSRGRREEAYSRLRGVLRDSVFAPPRALAQLAQITDFDLFVSTTFDPLLEQAINAERFGGAAQTDVVAYAPNRVNDLPTERERLTRPLVYHLLGRVSASPTYVLSDEDLLEFICGLQSEHLAPERLFHELEHNHLLLIGGNFSNWLARMFLRMTKRRRLSDPRDVGEVLADGHSSDDRKLMAFLQQVSVRTRVFAGAAEFVDELHARWLARAQKRPGWKEGRAAAPGDERNLATVLFADIVGSTELAARLGDRAWREILQRFIGLASAQIAAHRGRLVDTAGDGIFATFDAPARAVSCALALTRDAHSLDLQIRAGLHTGEIEASGDKVAGIAVHIGARVMSLAAAGEVLVSSTVKDLTAGAGLGFEPRGAHALKGVPGEWALHRVLAG
ncbi:MAG TPA: adenylate/guanylate cyclase domain-containing protein [Caldimonas sp.]|nr:adenylate/guanylate cyclase domain-containing protein [Caldimonas sp.]HEV7578308.1 adenylate/guanylate cyclase domain-containing protein [Caldimonas sp.]